jgi:hypothetical protein
MPAIGLWLLGLGRVVTAWLSRRSLAELAALALVALCLIQFISIRADHREIAKLKSQISKCAQARKADQDAYRKAQSDAAVKNKAQVEHVKAEQEKINEDVATKYERDLARLRAGNVRNGPAPSGPTSHPGPPDAGKAPSGIGGQVVSLPGPELLRAQEIELQLNALIDWVNGQSQIDPNKI